MSILRAEKNLIFYSKMPSGICCFVSVPWNKVLEQDKDKRAMSKR